MRTTHRTQHFNQHIQRKTVASVLASSATPLLPGLKRSAMMPEPITAQSKAEVPKNSAKSCRFNDGELMRLQDLSHWFAASVC